MTEPIVTLSHIRKSFGPKEVLKDLNFSITPGSIVGYIGPNGAGKSTTVKMMLGLLEPDDGTLELFGQPISPKDPSYKRRIGYVPESADVFDALTAREYLSLTDAEQKAFALAELVNLRDAFDRRISSYSKGMRQLILIIASLLHNPDILFWDEPLNGLDANTVLVIEEVLQDLRDQGKTIFYSSHILDVVQKLSDRIIVLNAGTVVADGPFKAIAKEADTNLQQLFNDLTGFAEHGQKAQSFVDIVTGGDSHEDA